MSLPTKKPDDFAATGLKIDSGVKLLRTLDGQTRRLTDKFKVRELGRIAQTTLRDVNHASVSTRSILESRCELIEQQNHHISSAAHRTIGDDDECTCLEL